jgi:hypothetical protein
MEIVYEGAILSPLAFSSLIIICVQDETFDPVSSPFKQEG